MKRRAAQQGVEAEEALQVEPRRLTQCRADKVRQGRGVRMIARRIEAAIVGVFFRAYPDWAHFARTSLRRRLQ